LARPRNDAKLSGVIIREPGHRHFMDSAPGAQKAGVEVAMKGVELACDAMAMLPLSLIGPDPAGYGGALRKIETLLKGGGYRVSLRGRLHPTAAERASFVCRHGELLES
jgi:hypothetical protein